MVISMSLQLTDEQQQVVNHNQGPALVFAVAGAGKTTAMVHRIARLSHERVFAPHRILATSFSRAAVQDIRQALSAWESCENVQVMTLHSLGYRILRQAAALKLIPPLRQGESQGDAAMGVLAEALRRARSQGVPIDDGLERDDVLDYIGRCKGMLQYADLDRAQLPDSALNHASQAEAHPDHPYYLSLYQIFEQVRAEREVITFDDMLLLAWEQMVRSKALCTRVQRFFDAVMVDEFQDINYAQSELLDLITAPHRNYMAIGDDDQTIYEWRGADTRFILEFEARYSATRYLISDNFRCGASHLALANAVIRHNRSRQQKHLNLTRGFEGTTHIHNAPGQEAMAQQLVAQVSDYLSRGYQLSEMVVLIRLYAQTPYLEQALSEAEIPFHIVGSTSFAQRPEVVTLLYYLRLGEVERLRRSGLPLGEELQGHAGQWIGHILNRPTRYLPQATLQRLRHAVLERGLPLSAAALEAAESDRLNKGQQAKLRRLAEHMAWLADALPSLSAARILQELEQRLDYTSWLQSNSMFAQVGQGRAETINALIEYARGRELVPEFLDDLRRLGQRQSTGPNSLAITTIFRAKGLEWPIVFVPHCNQGTLPYALRMGSEEERRLFYVAITRTQRHLHLLMVQDQQVSQFLQEANYRQTLQAVETLASVMHTHPAQWQPEQALHVLRYTHELSLRRFLEHWWTAPAEHRDTASRKVQEVFHSVRQRDWLRQLSLSGEHLQLWEHLRPVTDLMDVDVTGLVDLLPKVTPQARSVAFAPGIRVESPQFGAGTIIAITQQQPHGQLLEIAFDTHGTKRLFAKFAKLQSLA